MTKFYILECTGCKNKFTRSGRLYKKRLSNIYFCNENCYNIFRDKKITKPCCECGIAITRTPSSVRSINFFCNSSCAAKYNNKNKISGYRRSKLEIFIESKIKETYPDLEVFYNKLFHGYEFDIRIPSLNLAIELNGFLHYKPVYGQEKLERIQKNDQEKIKIAEEHTFNLVVIPCIDTRPTNPIVLANHWNNIFNIIQNKI